MTFAFNPLTGRLDLTSTLTSPLQFMGGIAISADFPTAAVVIAGQMYEITADVTDNDPAKTNTGLSFLSGDEIAWDGNTWINLGGSGAQYELLANKNQPSGYPGLDVSGDLVGVLIPRSGTGAEIDAIVLADGEVATTTDTLQLRIGDGSTPGGQAISGNPLFVETNATPVTGSFRVVNSSAEPALTIDDGGVYISGNPRYPRTTVLDTYNWRDAAQTQEVMGYDPNFQVNKINKAEFSGPGEASGVKSTNFGLYNLVDTDVLTAQTPSVTSVNQETAIIRNFMTGAAYDCQIGTSSALILDTHATAQNGVSDIYNFSSSVNIYAADGYDGPYMVSNTVGVYVPMYLQGGMNPNNDMKFYEWAMDITQVRGIYVSEMNLGNNVLVTNYMGLEINGPLIMPQEGLADVGSIANCYGIKIGDIDASSIGENYSIKTGYGKSMFGDSMWLIRDGTVSVGTVTVTTNTTCTGTGTRFLSMFNVGDNILLGKTNETKAITAIASDTVMTIASATNTTNSTYFPEYKTRMIVELNGNVGLNLEAPKATLHVNGGIIGKVTPVTNTYTILHTDSTITCERGTAFVVTLPPATTDNIGQIFNIKNIGAGDVTLTADATGTADLIDGAATQTISQWENMTVQCYAADKWGIM